MAITKRSKKRRAGAARAKSPARTRTAKTAATPPARKTKPRAQVATPAAKPKTRAAKRPAPAATAKRANAKATAVESAEITALKAKFQRERKGLERSFTEAVQEIGLLRHHELRATHLERQLADRDATIARLQAQLAELERRPAEPVYVHEVQQSLALGGPTREAEAADLDEFEEDTLPEEEADVVREED
jgi:hypothetical protein